MEPTPSGGSTITLALANEQAMRDLAVDLANALDPGDVVALSGDLGAGKTTLARAMIRHLASDPKLDVPSPTFTLMQSYELPRFVLVHADFFRLAGPDDLRELGFEDLPAGAVLLIEWPDRAPELLPGNRLEVEIKLDLEHGPDYRSVRITGYRAFAAAHGAAPAKRGNFSKRRASARPRGCASPATPRPAPTSASRSASATPF